jgi:hypothetical protein
MTAQSENPARDAESRGGTDRPFNRPAPLPFQFQIPLGGGPLGVAVPFGGYGSPFAFTIPLGGAPPAPPPATVAVPVMPLAGASKAQAGADDRPVLVASGDAPLYVAPSEAADEASESAVGEWVLAAAEAAGQGAAQGLPGPSFITRLLREWLGPLDARAFGAFGSRERAPSATALFNALMYPNRGKRDARQRVCRELFQVVAEPGQALSGVRARRGDVLVRVARGEGWGSLAVVGSPGVHSQPALRELELRGEGHPRSEAGHYLHVIDLGPPFQPFHTGFARRLGDRSGIVLPNTLLLRLKAGSADVDAARAYSFYNDSGHGALRRDAPFADYAERAERQPVVCTCSSGSLYHYTTAFKTVANLVGVKASIKTRYGKLCCEGVATTAAHSVTYMNISMAGTPLRWAQTGYGRARSPGSRTIANDHYLEVRGGADEYFIQLDRVAPPPEGSTHGYQITLDKSTGKWTAGYDANGTWFEHTSPGWRNKTGATVQWTGEILNEDDDMSGTDADKCEFRGCAYQQDGASFTDAALTNTEVRSDDAPRWGVLRLSGTSFCIWDKAPNP